MAIENCAKRIEMANFWVLCRLPKGHPGNHIGDVEVSEPPF